MQMLLVYDNDHSFSQLPVHKALTRPQGQSAWAVASLVGEGKSLSAKKKKPLNNVFRSHLLPLEIQCSCICAGKEMCFTQDECVMRNPGYCFFGRVCLLWLLWCCGGSTVD